MKKFVFKTSRKSKTRHLLTQSREVRKGKDDEKMDIKNLCAFARGFFLVPVDPSGLGL